MDSLPIVVFTFDGAHGIRSPWIAHTFPLAVATRLGRLGEQPWQDLQTLTVDGALWFDQVDHHGLPISPRISFAAWTFKTLIVNLPPQPANWRTRPFTHDFFNLFLDPVTARESATWWVGLERIELRVPSEIEDEFRLRRLDAREKAGPLGGLQKRILPLIVFVREDGRKGWLMEQE